MDTGSEWIKEINGQICMSGPSLPRFRFFFKEILFRQDAVN